MVVFYDNILFYFIRDHSICCRNYCKVPWTSQIEGDQQIILANDNNKNYNAVWGIRVCKRWEEGRKSFKRANQHRWDKCSKSWLVILTPLKTAVFKKAIFN